MIYTDDELLALSGIQHFAFCRRQWALIHIEKQWEENLRTVQGRSMHERVDNPELFEARKGVLTARSVPIASYKLGFFGFSDVVEFIAVEEPDGVAINNRQGRWQPIPVEYKRGRPKSDVIDEVQLCAQAICLEEMLNVKLEYGYLFYGETKHRTKVLLDSVIRKKVFEFSTQMHKLFISQITPECERPISKCKACSLFDICVPKITSKKMKGKKYIKNFIEDI